MAIPIGIKGRIVEPEVQEQYVLVEDDLNGTGGYYVHQSADIDLLGHDYWVLEIELDGFFDESGWRVEWFN